MDPKNLSQLDPKLREVYERVMGTSQNPPVSNAAPTPPQKSIIEPVPSQPEKPILQPIMTSSPTSSPASNAAPAESDSASPSPKVEMSIKPKNKTSPLIIGLAAVAFLLVYALVWIKVFNLQLPFLP